MVPVSLYEHQSTYNPNMPLRGFLYYADLYRKIIERPEQLYRRSLLKIPCPQYIVFYNGPEKDMEEDRKVLRLSDAFEEKPQEGVYEWTAIMININCGKNESILKSCRILEEYSIFVDKIKQYRKTNSLEKAINTAVEECIQENVLKAFLERHRREVCDMCLTEFDEKEYEKICREEGREEGLAEGRTEGRMAEIFSSVQEGDYRIQRGAQKAGMSVEAFEKAMTDAGYKIPVPM